MIKIVKNSLVITIPVKKVMSLLEEQINGEPTEQLIEQPVEPVDTTTGDITGGEPTTEVVPEGSVLPTPEAEGNTPVQQ